MKRHTLFLLFMLVFPVLLNAQRVYHQTTDAGSMYPVMSIENVITMYTISGTEMDRNMRNFTTIRDDFQDLGVAYTLQAKKNSGDGLCFITKKPDAVEFVFTPGENALSLITPLQKELEPFYIKDVQGNQVFSVDYEDGYTYIIILHIVPGEEYLRIYRKSTS
ncbi:MAG: hypothetical protein R2794_05225 [Chitinophagales bacterium]